MKKLISLLLICCTLAVAFTACNSGETPAPTASEAQATEKPTETQAETEAPDKNPEVNAPDADGEFEPVLRFAVTSDIHIEKIGDRNYLRTENFIKQLNEYAATGADGYSKLDAILIAGDLTNNGTLTEFNAAKDVLDANVQEDTKLVISMGNHDWNNNGKDGFASESKFEGVFGLDSTTSDVVIGGYHFITVVGDASNGWDYSKAVASEAETLIKNAIADTGKDKPVFVIQHIGNVDTAIGTSTAADNKANTAVTALTEMQSKYENLVVFSGHTHFPANDECSIWQEDFTSINTGTLNYAMRSMVNGEWINIPNNRQNIAQGYVVEMDAAGRMRVRVWDVFQSEFIGETWLVESWNKDSFYYNKDRFSKEDIFFAEDAQVSVEALYTTSAIISFPPVPKESLSGRVYEITLRDEYGDLISTQYKGTEYFNEDFDTPIQVSVGGLAKDTEYTVEVRAVNSLYTAEITQKGTLYSDAISTTFTTPEEEIKNGADIVDMSIDADGKKVVNNAVLGFGAQVVGSPDFSYDESIGKDVVSFKGSSSDVVKFESYETAAELMKDSMTFEVYFKIDERPEGRYFSAVSAQQSGGFGLDVYGSASSAGDKANKCMFHYHNGSAYKSLGFEYEIGVYYHIVAVYDGRSYILYLDGERLGSVSVGSELSFPSAKNLYMGGDTTGSGDCEAPSKCTVAGLKIYSYALSASEVEEAYNEMTE